MEDSQNNLCPKCGKPMRLKAILTDLKTFGSFKVAKSLGLKPSGKGQYTQSEDDAEMIDIELQLNNYRLMLKKQLGISVDRMQVQVTVRDGDLWSARKAGVDDSMYMIPVKMLDDDEVEKYFKNKAERLLLAMKQGYWGVACNEHESWKTRKCKKYCEVWEHCLQGMEVHL